MPKETIFKVEGADLLKKVQSLIKEGNVRRIVIRNKEGKSYLEIPMNIGILGVFLAPTLIAVGTIAAMATSFSIEVIRKESPKTSKTTKKK